MWLLHTETKELTPFYSDFPKYAILSHTWQDEEVLYQDVILKHAFKKKGWNKITECCLQAIQDGLNWVWVHTCCIDKTSSAELSEAINSMFRWYRDAAVCYAYLEDVYTSPEAEPDELIAVNIVHSRWFTRGWTLQELIAPSKVLFFSNSWEYIGTRKHLAEKISDVSGIHLSLLLEERTLSDYTVAQRFSWAASRQTTREEDQAYSLLGIFNVNMPLLYGEGPRAFQRLQEQILLDINELSILAWEGSECQALAPSLSRFANCQNVVLSDVQKGFPLTRNITKNNVYLNITAAVCSTYDAPLVALLGCRYAHSVAETIGVKLVKSPARVADTDDVLYCNIDEASRPKSVNVKDAVRSTDFRNIAILLDTSRYRPSEFGNRTFTHVSVDQKYYGKLQSIHRSSLMKVMALWPKAFWTDDLTFDLLKARDQIKTVAEDIEYKLPVWRELQKRPTIGVIVIKLYHDSRYSDVKDKIVKICFRRTAYVEKHDYKVCFQYAVAGHSQVEQWHGIQFVGQDYEDERNSQDELNLRWIESEPLSLQWPDGEGLLIEFTRACMTDADIACLTLSHSEAHQ